MSAPEDIAHAKVVRRERTAAEIVLAVLLIGVVAVAVLVVGARYGVLLPQARFLIEAGANGLKVGRLGRLQIEGLSGDIWRDIGIRKLTIRDEGGVWLQADNVHMTWRYGSLLRRNFYADTITAQSVKLLRRPTLTAKGKDTGLPVSLHIGDARARVELTPAFSYVRGVYDLDLNIDVARNEDKRGQVRATSVLHPGDYLYVDYDLAKTRPLEFLVDAEEARDGALAGALGLPSGQPFYFKVAAGGSMAAGRFGAVAGSGKVEALRAQGDWSADGGAVAGRVILTASTLAAPYARRLGPEASFVLAGRRAGPNLFALDARIGAQNLSARAQGLADVGARRLGPQGVNLTAETAELSRITGGPDLGRTRIAGRLTQAGPALRFAGTGAVSQASF
ncbi:MAG TPA: translocation/assembly module TamB, partial [Phenylobacterium sp.]|nr:translocation/assembly module TamB [Phenylobacterium sp.]